MERAMYGQVWLDEDIELLQRLWADGETAATIAGKLGFFSRSAVLGKVFRLRLGSTGIARKPGVHEAAAPVASEFPKRRRRGPQPQSLPAAKPDLRHKSLFELTNTCCRWPYRRPGTEKYFFCGVPEADLERGMPYCPRHMKRAYLVPPNAGHQPRNVFRAA